jgi:hypothetical protein
LLGSRGRPEDESADEKERGAEPVHEGA